MCDSNEQTLLQDNIPYMCVSEHSLPLSSSQFPYLQPVWLPGANIYHIYMQIYIWLLLNRPLNRPISVNYANVCVVLLQSPIDIRHPPGVQTDKLAGSRVEYDPFPGGFRITPGWVDKPTNCQTCIHMVIYRVTNRCMPAQLHKIIMMFYLLLLIFKYHISLIIISPALPWIYPRSVEVANWTKPGPCRISGSPLMILYCSIV